VLTSFLHKSDITALGLQKRHRLLLGNHARADRSGVLCPWLSGAPVGLRTARSDWSPPILADRSSRTRFPW